MVLDCELTAERLRAILHYDPLTGTFTWRESHRGRHISEVAGTLDRGYVKISIDGTQYRANRLAFLYMTGEWPAGVADHRNRRKSDNRWINLRDLSQGDNSRNRSPVRNKLGVPGVHLDRESGKFRAEIRADGRRIRLGRFASVEAASAAYQAAKREFHPSHEVA